MFIVLPLRIRTEENLFGRGVPRSRNRSRYVSSQDGQQKTHHTCPRFLVHTSQQPWKLHYKNQLESVHLCSFSLGSGSCNEEITGCKSASKQFFKKEIKITEIWAYLSWYTSNLYSLDGTSIAPKSAKLANWHWWWFFRKLRTGTMPSGATSNSSSSPVTIWTFWTYLGIHSAT